jgi:hypothetical protein
MRIPPEIMVLIILPLGAGLIAGMLLVNDRIIRHICRREGRKYSILWFCGSYWHWRAFNLSWFKEAKEAGYFNQLVTLYVAWFVFVIAFTVLNWPI